MVTEAVEATVEQIHQNHDGDSGLEAGDLEAKVTVLEAGLLEPVVDLEAMEAMEKQIHLNHDGDSGLECSHWASSSVKIQERIHP